MTIFSARGCVQKYCIRCNAFVMILSTVIVCFSTLSVFGEAPIEFKYPYRESKFPAIKSGVSTGQRKEGNGDPKKGELISVLTVTIKKERGYSGGTNYPFGSVLRGIDPDHNDTDSAQVAVRWSNQGNPDVGHDTNARARGVRPQSADWPDEKNIGMKDHAVSWDTPIPANATKVEIVILYTDMLSSSNIFRANNKNPQDKGDVPGIIGSWTGKKQDNGKWEFTANNGDIYPQKSVYPTNEEVVQSVKEAKDALLAKTGYKLVERPESLGGIPITEQQKILDAIVQAVKEGKINPLPDNKQLSADTGFDIIRR
jgi:hypothetical protein